MAKFRMSLLAVAALAIAIAGCGTEDPMGPSPRPLSPGPLLLSSQAVSMPTDVVFVVDTSDSSDAAGIQAAVNGLLDCFGNELLVPRDSSVSVSVIAYGDSAQVVVPLTPVGPDGAAPFAAALDSLATQRPVAGGNAELDAALRAAAGQLAAASTSNRHVVLMGDGRSTDDAGTQAECGNLAGAGVKFSALVFDAQSEDAPLLQACALAANGQFVAVGPDALAGACQELLQFVIQATLTLEPASAELPKDATHELLATLYRGSEENPVPLVGFELQLAVTGGPNAGAADTMMTDEAGQASFEWSGNGQVGTDSVRVEAVITAVEPVVAMATVTWRNTAPECDAGEAQSVTWTGEPLEVTLDGSASFDADPSDTLSYEWSVGCEGASLDDPTAIMPTLTLGIDCGCEVEIPVTLTVSDGIDSSTCETSVTLLDGVPPEIVLADEPVVLWPPNHKMVAIHTSDLFASVSDECDDELSLADLVLVSVASDEPMDGLGDGNHQPDVELDCEGGVWLRAERSGLGDGRVYSLSYELTDAAGNVSTATAKVMVPHDQSGDDVIEGEMAYEMDGDAGCDE